MNEEGNIISFKVFIDKKGKLMTEYSYLPKKEITKFFDGEDSILLHKVLKELDPMFTKLHKKLEKELESFI
jgi:hypothetical protein|tara:strand:+ start:559 stop:771 length:213 start_codon:yes stop_codon:yes gene_type:complete